MNTYLRLKVYCHLKKGYLLNWTVREPYLGTCEWTLIGYSIKQVKNKLNVVNRNIVVILINVM